MKKLIIIGLFAIVIFAGTGEICAQSSAPTNTPCQPSAEEVLSLIKSAFNLSPVSDAVLVAGEVPAGGQHLRVSENLITLTQGIAMAGGILKTGSGLIYVIRGSAEGEKKTKLEISYKDIKQGRTKDLIVERGEVIFVPRGCSKGKLLKPSPKQSPAQLRSNRPYPKVFY